MKKLFVNITSWIGISPGAIHYYAKRVEFESDKNIYVLANNGFWSFGEKRPEEFYRILTNPMEVQSLNKADGKGSNHKVGEQTLRFNTVDEIKQEIEATYPEHDIAYFYNNELESEDMDVIERNSSMTKKTGRKIKIGNFEGFGSEFVKLTQDSIHDVIECPERYLDRGPSFHYGNVWVKGVTEPVRVLRREFEFVK